MNKTRVSIITVVIVVVAAGICACWVVPRVWPPGGPEYDWRRAQAAYRRDELGAARIHLKNLLGESPHHDAGHMMMAEILLAEARAAGKSPTLAANPRAMAHLVEAGKLRSGDLALQQRLLATYLEMGRLPEAARIAERLEDAGQADVEALFALAWRATRQRDVAAAETYFDRLWQLPSRRVFQTAALAVELYEATGSNEKLAQTFTKVAGLARTLDAGKLALLLPADRDQMCRLLLRGAQQAADPVTAHDRAQAALVGCEKLAAARLHPPGPLAATASRVVLSLDQEHPLPGDAGDDQALRLQLRHRAATLGKAALDADAAEPLVYLQVAQDQFARGENEPGLLTLRQGIAAAEKLADPPPRELLDLHLLAARKLLEMQRSADARPHLKPLLAEEGSDMAGWGHLLAGTIEFREGKFENALQHYQRAGFLLGRKPSVRAALANVYLALEQWQPALEHLAFFDSVYQQLDKESRDWTQTYLGSAEKVSLGMLQANLALDRWDEAGRQLEALKNTQFEAHALALAAAYLWRHQRPDEALEMLNDARNRFPGDARLLRLAAHLLQQTGKVAEADELVERAVAETPDDLAIQLVWCQQRLAQGRAKEAAERLGELAGRLEMPEGQSAARLYQAHALLAAGDAAGAAAVIQSLREDPRFATAAGLLHATANLQQENLSAAHEALQMAQEIGPRHGLLNFLAGRLALDTGDYQTALDELDGTLDVTNLRRPAGQALLQAVQLMSAAESPAAAEARVDQLLEDDPQDPVLLIAKADLQIQQNQFNRGIALLRQVQVLQPRDPTATILAAVAWLQRDRPESALGELYRALEIAPQHIHALLLASRASLAAQQYAEAYGYAAAALEQDPGLWQAELLQAESLRALGRTEKAVKVLTRLIGGQQKPLAAFTQLVDIYRDEKQLDKALETCRAGRTAWPDDFSLAALEITLVSETGDPADVRQLAEQASGETPAFKTCLELAAVLARGKHFAEARDWGRRALDMADEKQRPHAQLMLGKVLRNLSRTNPDRALVEQARDHFAAVVAAHPTHVNAANNLAWLLATEFQQADEAVAVLAELGAGDTAAETLPVDVLDTFGVVYRQAGRSEEIEPLFVAALRFRPNHPTLLFHLGMAQADINKPRLAVSHLRKALNQGLAGQAADEARRELETLLASRETLE